MFILFCTILFEENLFIAWFAFKQTERTFIILLSGNYMAQFRGHIEEVVHDCSLLTVI